MFTNKLSLMSEKKIYFINTLCTYIFAIFYKVLSAKLDLKRHVETSVKVEHTMIYK